VPRVHQNRDEGLSGDPAELSMANIRGLMRKYEHGMEELAKAARLSVSTVINMAYGITVRPQDRTVDAILDALGYRRPIVPKGAKPKEEIKSQPYWPGNIRLLRDETRAKRQKSS
jgi:hypothetical protein